MVAIHMGYIALPVRQIVLYVSHQQYVIFVIMDIFYPIKYVKHVLIIVSNAPQINV